MRLEQLDKAVDVEFIVMQRVVEACADIMRPYTPHNPMGEDMMPSDNPGFYHLVVAMYDRVRGADLGNGDELIDEYQTEEKKKLALGEGNQITVALDAVKS